LGRRPLEDVAASPLRPFRSALVTGGRSGIGAALVAALEAEATEVRVLDLADGFDVADPRSWDDVGAVDFAALNAGVTTGQGDMTKLTDEQYRRILRANVDGVVNGVRRLAQVMEAGGAIVATASLAGLTTMELDPIYAATKHFVVGFVRSVARQLGERGITINAVCPAIVDTPLLGEGNADRIRDAGYELLSPDEVAAAILKAARSGEMGRAWPVIPGRPVEPHEFHRFFEST
jgi:NAD(P)-dependent dehydrogenase (short-subunit alcohol dehydrogenase family)